MADEDLPVRIGSYRVLASLGGGGMGEVFLGESDGRRVAIKRIHPGLASNQEFRRRFAHEVELCKRVSSASCAVYVDSDLSGSSPWMATEYIAGPNLHEAVSAGGALEKSQAEVLALGLAEALRQLHRAGIVHRDLKPSNVILGVSGPRVIDFGIARAADQTALTRTGGAIGSPGWMAPEQLRNGELSEYSDVFAWGALVAYASSGRPPFGDSLPETLMYRVLNEEPDLDGVPEPLRSLCGQALAKHPSERPDAKELVATLVGGQPTTSLGTQVTQRIDRTWLFDTTRYSSEFVTLRVELDIVTEGPTQIPAGPEVGADRRRRRRWIGVSTALFLALLIAGFTIGAIATTSQQISQTATSRTTTNGAEAAPDSTSPSATQDSITSQSTTTLQSSQFRYTIPQTVPTPRGSTTPPMPSTLAGYRREPSGDGSSIVRVFGRSFPSIATGFMAPQSGCSQGAWTIRWRSLNPDVTVIAYPTFYVPSSDHALPSPAPSDATSGFLGTEICQGPAFTFGEALNGNGSNLVDVAVEWELWTAAP